MNFQLQNLDRYSEYLIPGHCRGCGWWQGYDDGWPGEHEANAWRNTACEIFGTWGKLALADDQVLGMIQYGPAGLFARSRRLPAGPVSDNAVLISCGCAAEGSLRTVERSLITAVLTELKQRRVDFVEAFCAEAGKNVESCCFFSPDFLRDCGFYPVRSHKGLKLMRLEIRGTETAGPCRVPRRGLLERIKRRPAPPVPVATAGVLKAWPSVEVPRNG